MVLYCPNSPAVNGPYTDGVPELCPTAARPALFFTELILDGNLAIPPQKPPKVHIIKDTHEVKLTDVELLPVFLPGNTTTTPNGYKIVVSGIFSLLLEYIAEGPEQKVHVVHFNLPFNALILNDCGGLIPPDKLPDDFVVHVCVEKIRYTQINNRTIQKEIVLMVWVEEL